MILSLITHNLLWTEGREILCLLVALGLVAFIWYRPLAYVIVLLVFLTICFFRNPDRVCIPALHDNTILICPADGKVIDIQRSMTHSLEGYAQQVSIFLSPLDVHVNWIPMAGIIKDITYRSGTFSLAFLPKSSEYNERNDIVIQRFDGNTIKIRQIAGTIARRICCWLDLQQEVCAGDKYGMIRFGSRVEVFMPATIQLHVGVGQRVYGGQTVLGKWSL